MAVAAKEKQEEKNPKIQEIVESFNEIWKEVWHASSDITGLCNMIDTLNAGICRKQSFDYEGMIFINGFFTEKGKILEEMSDKIEELWRNVIKLLEEGQA